MEESATRVALYAREVAPTEPAPEPSLYLPDKWDELEKALEPDAEVVAVAFQPLSRPQTEFHGLWSQPEQRDR